MPTVPWQFAYNSGKLSAELAGHMSEDKCVQRAFGTQSFPKVKPNLTSNSKYMPVILAAEPVAYPYLQEVISRLPSIIRQR